MGTTVLGQAGDQLGQVAVADADRVVGDKNIRSWPVSQSL